MRAGIPVQSAGRRSGALSPSRRSIRRPLRGFPRNKSPAAEEEDPQVPVLLQRDMNLCYRLLRRLVPGLPPGRTASRMEILQHVIDYILDLQTELDGLEPGDRSPATNLHTCQPDDQSNESCCPGV